MANSIFRKQSLDRVNSPEQLNDYIKTSNLSVWLVIFAVLILILSVFIWAIFGTLDTTVTIDGVSNGNTVVCFTDNIGDIKVNNNVKIGDATGTVTYVSGKPVSYEEAVNLADADEYTLYCLDLAKFNYVVEIEVDNTISQGYILADVVVEKVSPVSFIFG